MFGYLQKLQRYVLGDDDLDRRAAERNYHASIWGKRGRTEQRPSGQKRNDAVLWQHESIRGSLHASKELCTEHYCERAKITATFKCPDGVRHWLDQVLAPTLAGNVLGVFSRQQ